MERIKKKRRFVVVTGGVLSGLGKGIVTSSLGLLLKSMGYRVVPVKVDPYINIDAGTMNPYEHGEVFVLDDGYECDMDLGHYERFMDINLSGKNNITTGKVFKEVIERERKGVYLGKTVQLIPHVTSLLNEWYFNLAEKWNADVVLIEIGGTVGDIENQVYLEAVRELAISNRVVFVHCSFVPKLRAVGEQKTKPTQQSVQRLREMGIQPDFIVCRSEEELTEKTKEKISLFCNVDKKNIISDPDLESIYMVPLHFKRQRFAEMLVEKLGMKPVKPKTKMWEKFVNGMKSSKECVNVAITGKYTELRDAYISLKEAITHASACLKVKSKITWVETTHLNSPSIKKKLRKAHAIIVPGGFGSRGAEGKVKCIEYARVNDVPFLGICFGFQLAVVEFARNVCGLDANSTEIDPKTKHPVVKLLPQQKKVYKKGGTMRLGSYKVYLQEGSLARKVYRKRVVEERFRHRYEFNPDYREMLERMGMVFSGYDKKGEIVQVLELPSKRFFLGVQFHPEFKSRPLRPHPVFVWLIKAAVKFKLSNKP